MGVGGVEWVVVVGVPLREVVLLWDAVPGKKSVPMWEALLV